MPIVRRNHNNTYFPPKYRLTIFVCQLINSGTAADVFWSDVPVVTLAGGKMSTRLATGLIRSSGTPGKVTVTHSFQEFEDVAVSLVRRQCGPHSPPVARGGAVGYRPVDGLRALLRRRRKNLILALNDTRRLKTPVPLFDTEGWVRGYETTLSAAAESRFARGATGHVRVALNEN